MRAVTAILLCSVAGAAFAQKTGGPPPEVIWESAIELKLAPCPADVRNAVRGIDSTADWRLVIAEDFRFCVPAEWKRREPPYAAAYTWTGDSSGINAMIPGRTSVSMDAMYPRNYSTGSRQGVYFGAIDGAKVEMWHRQPSSTERPQGGYETVALFRRENVMFMGGAKTRAQVDLNRLIVQTTRFTGTRRVGSP